MAARHTIERVLRDDDDASGQSIREWKIESEGSHIMIRRREGDGFVMLRAADVDTFVADLRRAQDAAKWLAEQS